MHDFAAKHAAGLTYTEFLDRYATPEQKQRWNDFHASITLTNEPRELLAGFTRVMNVLVVAGTWCGDCVNQCPIFEHFAVCSPNIRVRYLDRDDHPDTAEELAVCGGSRVPAVVFISEDGYPCGRYGDRTLAKYRSMAESEEGLACSTGIANADTPLENRVIADWLGEFERNQLILRLSGRLRKLHGD